MEGISINLVPLAIPQAIYGVCYRVPYSREGLAELRVKDEFVLIAKLIFSLPVLGGKRNDLTAAILILG